MSRVLTSPTPIRRTRFSSTASHAALMSSLSALSLCHLPVRESGRKSGIGEGGESLLERAASLVAQLNAIRNAKAAKRLAKQATKRAAHSKKVAEIEASKGARRKEERKRKFVEEGRKERAAAKRGRGGGGERD